ncbi:MAG: hypothetical protein NVS3B11_01390 [Collimonas sp.]
MNRPIFKQNVLYVVLVPGAATPGAAIYSAAWLQPFNLPQSADGYQQEDGARQGCRDKRRPGIE